MSLRQHFKNLNSYILNLNSLLHHSKKVQLLRMSDTVVSLHRWAEVPKINSSILQESCGRLKIGKTQYLQADSVKDYWLGSFF